MNVMILLISGLLLTIVFIIVVFIFSFWLEKNSRESLNVIECGIESKNTSRNPFSIRFFLFIILFIIFDMEILLILHFPFSFKESNNNKLVVINQFFFFLLMFILFVGSLIEKSQGALHWQDYFLK